MRTQIEERSDVISSVCGGPMADLRLGLVITNLKAESLPLSMECREKQSSEGESTPFLEMTF
jgi:hypothetical protein